MQKVLIVSLSLFFSTTLLHSAYLSILFSPLFACSCCSNPLYFFLGSPLIWYLPLLACTTLLPASDIQTLPRVYFFDSYATLQANGNDSRCLSSSGCPIECYVFIHTSLVLKHQQSPSTLVFLALRNLLSESGDSSDFKCLHFQVPKTKD